MTVSWFDGVTLTVEIAFTTDPQDPAPSWDDVSADMRAINMSSGRTSEFSAISPSTLSITLDNRSRQYDPEYAAGPHFGDLMPMKKIRVRAERSGATYDLFTGYVQGWPQQYHYHFDSVVTITAVDGSRFLEQAILPASAYAAAVLEDAPLHYWPMQEANTARGSVYADVVGEVDLVVRTGDASSTNLAYPIGHSSAANAPDDPTKQYTQGIGYDPYIDSTLAALEMWVYVASYTGVNPEIEVQVATATGRLQLRLFTTATAEYEDLTPNLANTVVSGALPGTGSPQHVVAVQDGVDLKFYINGVQTGSVALSGPAGSADAQGVSVSLPEGTAENYVSHIAVYDAPLSADRVLAHYEAGRYAFGSPDADLSGERFERVLDDAGWPSAFRDISPGASRQGAYRPAAQSAMQYLRDVETSEDGLFFINGNGDVVFRDRQWLWTQAAIVPLLDDDDEPLLDEFDEPLTAGPFTFSDDGGGIPYREITIDANSVDVIRNKVSATYGPNDGYVLKEDATSLAAYGPATEALSVPTIDEAPLARSLVAYKLRTMKDPKSRVTSIMVQPRAKPATSFDAVLGLDIGNRVQVEITPMDLGTQVVKSLYVQGRQHTITVGGDWTTTFYLSPALAAEDVPYFIIGDSVYGRIGAAAGNRIPF